MLCFVLTSIMHTDLLAATRAKAQARVARQPFITFKAIDLQLTTIDRDLQELTASTDHAEKLHSAHQRSRAITQIRGSKTMKSLRSSAVSVLAITREVELHYRKRRQHYGVTLFKSLHTKAIRMAQSEIRIRHASKLAESKAAQKRFAADLLTFVLQFQAVSGGYGALQCGAGQWACCQPRSSGQGKAALAGCTWICATRRSTCRAGCLGPHVPKTAQAALNNARKNSQAK